MPRQRSSMRRSVAIVLAAALTALSAAVPLLDCGVRTGAWVLHGEHPLSAHAYAHDHTICAQHGAGSLPELHAVSTPQQPDEELVPALAVDVHIPSRPEEAPRRCRAPPAA